MKMGEINKKLKNLLLGNRYCGICLENNEELSSLQISVILPNVAKVFTMNDILKGVFGDMVSNMMFSQEVCGTCKTSAINAFIFIRKAKETAKLYKHYTLQLDSRAEEIIYKCQSNLSNILIILDNLAEDETIKNEKCLQNSTKLKVKSEGNNECYICDCCNRKYDTRKRIVNHFKDLRFRNKVKFSRCLHCPSTPCIHEKYLIAFKKEKDLNNGAVKCLDCDFECVALRVMIKHVNKEHLRIKIDCKLCGRVFYYRPPFVRHFKKCQYTEKPYKCDKCPAKFESKFIARMHIREHADVCWKCHICSSVFVEKTYLNQHVKRYHTFDVYECSVCHKDCKDPVKLYKHLSNHNPREKHKCISCDIEFSTRNQYIEHIRRIEHLKKVKGDKQLETRKFLCTICHVKFEDWTAYKEHKKTHKPTEKHKCTLCKLEFDTKIQYTMHTKKVGHKRKADPNKLKALKCNYCSFQTYHSQAHENHINSKHLKFVPHACHICGRGFPSVGGLNNHIKRHTVMGKYKNTSIDEKVCDLCGKLFRSKIAWQKHMRLHTGERPYPCDLCDQAFISASHRTAHKYRAHMERTFRCPICQSMFHTLSNLRLHIKKTHWKRPGKFDYRQIEGLSEEDYELFRDRRLLD